jgi:hypothetical protein
MEQQQQQQCEFSLVLMDAEKDLMLEVPQQPAERCLVST